MDKIIENLEQKVFTKYTKDLRDLTTDVKQKICFEFIKERLNKIKESNFKDNLKNWFLIVENLNPEIEEDIEQLEMIFLSSIMETQGFRVFAKKYIKENKN